MAWRFIWGRLHFKFPFGFVIVALDKETEPGEKVYKGECNDKHGIAPFDVLEVLDLGREEG